MDPGLIPAQVSKMTVFHDITLLHFVRQYSMPKELGSEPSRRRKNVVVIVRPYCSPDPNSPKYEQYCRQKLKLLPAVLHLIVLLYYKPNSYHAFAHVLTQARPTMPCICLVIVPFSGG